MRSLQEEAGQVVSREDVLGVVHAAGQVVEVDSGEGIDLARVTPEVDDTRVDLIVDDGVRICVNSSESIRGRPLIPVERNPLLSGCVFEASGLASDREELHERILAQLPVQRVNIGTPFDHKNWKGELTRQAWPPSGWTSD